MADVLSRDEIVTRYGEPERLADDVRGRVFAFRHESQEAAAAFASLNRDDGLPAWAEFRDVGWVSVVDLGPSIDATCEGIMAALREAENV